MGRLRKSAYGVVYGFLMATWHKRDIYWLLQCLVEIVWWLANGNSQITGLQLNVYIVLRDIFLNAHQVAKRNRPAGSANEVN